MRRNLVETALALVRSGCSILPCHAKLPKVSGWRADDWRPISEREARTVFGGGSTLQIAVLCGAVSRNLECLDFDDGGSAFASWCALGRQGAPGLLEQLPIQATPSGGRHVLYRLAEPGTRQILARRVSQVTDPAVLSNPKELLTLVPRAGRLWRESLLIETRSDGQYYISAPSLSGSRKPPYSPLQGDVCEPPLLTAAEYDVLINSARQLNDVPPDYAAAETARRADVARYTPSRRPTPADTDGESPVNHYNREGDWRSLLRQHGWTLVRVAAGVEYWRHPGAKSAHSATFDTKRNTFFVFSRAAQPFEECVAREEAGRHSYDPFGIYTTLEHGGDFSAATAALRKAGFGNDRVPADLVAFLKHYRDRGV